MILDRPPLYYDTLITQSVPPLVWDVEPLIVRGDRIVIFGEPGSYKSMLMLHLASHLGAGVHWLKTFTIREQRRVLYVDEEMNAQILHRNVKRLQLGSGITHSDMAMVSRLGIRMDPYGAQLLLGYLNTQKFLPHVIVFDALRRVLLGDENKQEPITQFWRNLEPISRLGITSVIIHHMNKPPVEGNRATKYRASGHYEIIAGSDASLAVERVSRSVVKLTGIKSRGKVELPPFYVEVTDDGTDDGPLWIAPYVSKGKTPLTPQEREDVLRRPVEGTPSGQGV